MPVLTGETVVVGRVGEVSGHPAAGGVELAQRRL
jgi:hypothetical protein